MHVPMRAVYPVLTLSETFSSLMKTKQGNNESLIIYLERFKSEKNVMMSLFAQKLLDGFVEDSQEYQDLPGGTDLADRQVGVKKRTMNKLWAILCICGEDPNHYGSLLVEFCKVYATKQRDLYPDDLGSMMGAM